MSEKTLLLGSRGSTPGRKLYFVTQSEEGKILLRTLDGTPIPDEKTKVVVDSLGGRDSLLNKCFVFNGTEEEFLALPVCKRGICWREVNKKWVEYLMANNPSGVRIGFIVDGLTSQAIMEGKKNGK